MGHDEHDHQPDRDGMDAAAWDATYEENAAMWSGRPNAQLVAEVDGLSPGSALDIGCGEGADAVWLAQRGWTVTAVDISEVALDRARGRAAEAEVEVTFEQRDVVTDPPSPATYDLVSAQFFHLPDPPRNSALRGLGEAVAAGGTLLVVGHQPGTHGGPGHADRLFAPQEITALFSPADWEVIVAETRSRRAVHHGEMTDLVDAVAVLRRLGTLESTT
ncbi:class I SAM-dependent methyltransferase [Aeromicrobium sp.]|uniref:class I SAM-dependent methyltransferase n=1 Tax=Aeromicrobium sp. TaxID=1871063 RepID=UPI00198871A5|nr:class I SAM-dependent methyltransferase [Aeromicrobium sp.]MBC7632372.1 class I SAM-dependent methyltransferase [Aeromicrobium sp.]